MILEFFLDLASPYAYLGLTRVERMAERHGCALVWHALDVEALKRSVGNVGPALADLPAKKAYVLQDAARWARRYGIPFTAPSAWRATRMNRGTWLAIDRGMASPYLAAAARRIWVDGVDPQDEAALSSLATELGWDTAQFLAWTLSGEAEARENAALARALEAGVFGVPSAVFGGRVWWGNDRLDAVEAALNNAKEASHG